MAAALGLLPLVLQILAAVLKWYGASSDLLDRYIDLVKQAQADNLITTDVHDKLVAQRQKILDRQKDQPPTTP